MINNIPTLSLEFTIEQEWPAQPQDLVISMRNVSPHNGTIAPGMLELLESLARDVVFTLGQEFQENIQARISYSPKEGLTIACPNRYKEIFQDALKLPSAVIPKEDAKRLGLKCLEKPIEDRETRKSIKTQFKGKKVVCVDGLALHLATKNFNIPGQINLEINGRKGGPRGGLATGCLRYPHLLLQLSTSDSLQPTKICLIGPGLLDDKEDAFCPQFAEMLTLFPDANFLLLDNNPRFLKVMYEQVQNGAILYDPLMLCSYTRKEQIQTYEKYSPLLDALKKGFTTLATDSSHCETMLNGKAKCEFLKLKVDPVKIQIGKFDIQSSELEAAKQNPFDLIIATLSLSLVIGPQISQNPRKNHFLTFAKYLKLLSENGTLYVDTPFIKVFEQKYGLDGIKVGIHYMETLLGNSLQIKEIPLSDFMPTVQGMGGVIDNLSLLHPEEHLTITTTSITAITRLQDKVDNSPEQLKLAQLSLAKMLQTK